MTCPEAYDLSVQPSEAKRLDLIALIPTGMPLPEKYRFLLFADKREVKRVRNGKRRDMLATMLPFQALEHIHDTMTLVPVSVD